MYIDQHIYEFLGTLVRHKSCERSLVGENIAMCAFKCTWTYKRYYIIYNKINIDSSLHTAYYPSTNKEVLFLYFRVETTDINSIKPEKRVCYCLHYFFVFIEFYRNGSQGVPENTIKTKISEMNTFCNKHFEEKTPQIVNVKVIKISQSLS